MTTLFCSNKLKDFIGAANFPPPTQEAKNKFGNWNAHLFTFNRKRNLIFVNNKSYYAVIVADIKKKQLNDIATLFLNRLTEQLVYDEVILKQEVLLILQKYLPVSLSSTNNDKKTLGTINDFIHSFTYYPSSRNPSHSDLLIINHNINKHLTGAGRNSKRHYGKPLEDMQKLLIEQ